MREKQASTEGLLLFVIKSRLLSLHQKELKRIIFVKPGGTKGMDKGGDSVSMYSPRLSDSPAGISVLMRMRSYLHFCTQ